MKRSVVGFWVVTALFGLQIGFTAYAQLRLPQVAEGRRLESVPANAEAHRSLGVEPASG